MFSDAEMTLAYKFGNASINNFPFPHFHLENVFPDYYYNLIQENLPNSNEMFPIEEVRRLKGYKERFVLPLNDEYLDKLPLSKCRFWKNLQNSLIDKPNFSNLVLSKFQNFIEARFKDTSNFDFFAETLLVNDITNYALGPHTDSPSKVVTLLFYLPADTSHSHLGTSIYMPNDPNFRCEGGPHYSRENFSLLHTNPYLPNSLFAFCKTDNSFHGVERVNDPDTKRWLLLFDIYAKKRQFIPAKPSVKFFI